MLVLFFVPARISSQSSNTSFLLKSPLLQLFHLLSHINMDSRSITLPGDKEVGKTATPSPRPSFEKESKTDLGDTTDQEDGSMRNQVLPEEDVEGQYPEGVRLACIVIALLLSIFLVNHPPESQLE